MHGMYAWNDLGTLTCLGHGVFEGLTAHAQINIGTALNLHLLTFALIDCCQ